MTRQKSFKRLVRARMEKTGESDTAARAALLAAEQPKATARPALATSDEAIRRRTGRGWEEWFDLLDAWGAAERPHKEIARWVAEQQGVEPLAWGAQAVAGSYERARGLRAVGEHLDGFAITASKTVAVPVDRLYEAFVDETRISVSLAAVELKPEGAGTRLTFTEQGAFLDGIDTPAQRQRGTGGLLDALGAELGREPERA